MVRCYNCNKKIGFFELMTKTNDKTYCSDCIVKDKSILFLIQDAMETHQYKGAIKMCDLLIKKIDLIPEKERKGILISAYTNKGTSFIILENYSKAITFFKKALEIDPKDTDILHKLSAVYFLDNQKDKALETLDKILYIKPKDKMALNLKKKHSN